MYANLPSVVVIDDNAAVLELFTHATKNLALELRTFNSADASMAYLKDNKPLILFLDTVMPQKDGLAFLQELRRLPLHSDTTVIMLSAMDYAQNRAVANELGATEFIVKPMPMIVITDTILKHINKEQSNVINMHD